MSTFPLPSLPFEANWAYLSGLVQRRLAFFSKPKALSDRLREWQISETELAFRRHFHCPSGDVAPVEMRVRIERTARKFHGAVYAYENRKSNYEISSRHNAENLDHADCERDISALRMRARRIGENLLDMHRVAHALRPDDIPPEVLDPLLLRSTSEFRTQLENDLKILEPENPA